MTKLRKNQIVAYTNYPGQTWKIVKVHAPAAVFLSCQRYDIQNQSGVLLTGCRDKDLIPKSDPSFNIYISL